LKLAAIDLGSNSVKLVCAAVDGGTVQPAIDRETICRVGEGLDRTGRLAEAAIERTMRVLAEDVRTARAFGAERIACVATAGLRGAENAGVLIERARTELGLPIEVIDGDREAELAFMALMPLYGPGPLTVIDIGGRSTEVIVGDANGIRDRISLDLGSVRMTERFLAHEIPTDAELAAMRTEIDSLLARAPEAEGDLFGVSGTALAIASFELAIDDIDAIATQGEGRALRASTVAAAFEALREKKPAERIRGTAIPAGRADVVVAGAAILLATLRRYDRESLRISGRGLRHALLYSMR
jgi:exopolyphosphatase/guanosine-5'-triphosphate,3'-diphosphate pyrophosphatase